MQVFETFVKPGHFFNAVRVVGTCTQPACQILSVVAMSYMDSEVVFRARCDEIKLAPETVVALKAKGWSTFGSYAFSISTNPGQISDDDFDAKVSIPILGAANHAEAALLRRLLFESYTLTATAAEENGHLRSRWAEKAAVQEIASRFEALELKIKPLRIESVLEPSHSLINSLAQCADDGRLRYIEWARCTSRTAELNNMKEQSSLRFGKLTPQATSGSLRQNLL